MTKDSTRPRGRGLRSIIAKMLAAVVLMGLVVVVPLVLTNIKTVNQTAGTAIKETGRMMSPILADAARGAVAFGKFDALESLVASVNETTSGSLVRVILLNADSDVLFEFGTTTGTDTALAQALATALDTGEEVITSDGFGVVEPILGNSASAPMGAIAAVWSETVLLNKAGENRQTALMLAIGIFAIGTVGLGAVIYFDISKPLGKLAKAVQAIAQKDYTTTVAGTKRHDEIGEIAKSVDRFRTDLGDAETASIEASYRSSAFEACSAALIVIDRDLEIKFANAAFQNMMTSHSDELKRRIPKFDPEAIVGQKIDFFHGPDNRSHSMLSQATSWPMLVPVELENLSLELEINPVRDASGAPNGYVLEWKDTTKASFDSAIMDAIDSNLAFAEFSKDGSLSHQNTNFANALNVTAQDLKGQRFSNLFETVGDLTPEVIWEAVSGGDPVTGQFHVSLNGGKTAIFDGSICPIRTASGKTSRVVLMANDITAAQTAIEAANTARRDFEAAQGLVVERLRDGLARLSGGDLTTVIEDPFSADYESLRLDFNSAVTRLQDAILSVVENADMIRGEASEISNAADDLSRRTEKQAATLEETATALDQLTASVHTAADRANQASTMVGDARKNAEASGDVVREAVTAMSEIENSSNQISKITSVIDDIAFQTNLLALNAGVEAARAGEAGRGFAVVASEVRALAQRSSDAAREINQLITASSGQVTRGVNLVDEAGGALKGIVVSVTNIATQVEEIAISAREQSSGLAEINSAVNQLDQVTQQNAAMFEQTTAASHALNREAETLSRTTAIFTVATTPSARRAHPAPASVPSPPRPTAPTGHPQGAATAVALAPDPASDWEDF
ncbi:Methyl-accepting chemotaxis protein I [Aquimixticola soesokkakensis]|uniref:Methyl-accepting chemotaxis protein I n=1 Tax=Aquimixticola soesokkakensis TaxID=1519096 RepID=A0A1Y5STJ5_9RHOB|nr:methyl-accepting chemotaxis protein [Aquimixticola soesokkakensis]SLN47988.1 Methyl-accepting chemotaxis protein I [Aquimixticola soesokkakensis]